MDRIYLPLVLAAVLAFAPWTEGGEGAVGFMGPVWWCLVDLEPSIFGVCAPQGRLPEIVAAYAVFASLFAGLFSIIGLLPFLRRLSGLAVAAAGLLTTAAAAVMLAQFALIPGQQPSPGWGVFAGLALGLLTLAIGVRGLLPRRDPGDL